MMMSKRYITSLLLAVTLLSGRVDALFNDVSRSGVNDISSIGNWWCKEGNSSKAARREIEE